MSGQNGSAAPTMRAAVIGAGAMGSGIAAQFANAGVEVLLLDIVPAGANNRNVLAKGAVERQLKAGGFMHPDQSRLVRIGNIEDDLGSLAEADWIVEAIIEDIELKRSLYQRIETVRKAGSVVSSNTSTLQLAALTAGLGERFRRDFAISHFFNPPRHMALLEVVAGEAIAAAAEQSLRRAALHHLGKTVVMCRDTPGFIANRIGCFWMSLAAVEAVRAGLTVEQADAAAGAPFAIPKTGVFGLFDLVGIDLIPSVWGSLLRALPAGDAHRQVGIMEHELFGAMQRRKLFGRKAGAGFYRISGDGAKRVREVLDLDTLEYRPEQPVELGARDVKTLLARDDALGRYGWTVLSGLVRYAAEVAPEIADDVAAIDTAMRLGYGWGLGPFQLADAYGASRLAERLRGEGRSVPALLSKAADAGGFYVGDAALETTGTPSVSAASRGVTLLARVRSGANRVAGNDAAALWDLGDGIAGFELLTKMNVIDPAAQDALEHAIERVGRDFKALVIGNDHPRAFSSGADLRHFVSLLRENKPGPLERFVTRGQQVYRMMLAAPFPVVGAGFGLALGGGCEMLLHCDRLVVHAELNAGLPEAKVGLLPGWGGCVRMLHRALALPGIPKGPLAVPSYAFETIIQARVSASALDARAMGIVRPHDRIVMSRDVLLAEARLAALSMVDGYKPPQPGLIAPAGPSGHASIMNGVLGRQRLGEVSEHDAFIASVTARVLTGGAADPSRMIDEDTLYGLERDGLVELVLTAKSRERIEQMLATGKALRN